MDRDAIKDRIRKLLNLAGNDAASEGEIENALKFAQRLMAQHAIDEAELEKAPEDRRTPDQVAASKTYGRVSVPLGSTNMSQWEVVVSNIVERLFGNHVQSYRTNRTDQAVTPAGLPMFDDDGNPVYRTCFVFYGPDEETRMVAELFEATCLTIASLARLKFGSVFKGHGRAYAEGFAEALWKKVKSENQHTLLPAGQAVTASGSGAIVLASVTKAIQHKAREVLAAEHGIKLGSGGGGRMSANRNDPGAYFAGRRDGERYELTRTQASRKLPGR